MENDFIFGQKENPKKLFSSFYQEKKEGITFQRIKERLELVEHKIKKREEVISLYSVKHKNNYSYLVRTYFVWKEKPEEELIFSSLRVYYDQYNISYKELSFSGEFLNLIGKKDQLSWPFNGNNKLAFPIFKLSGRSLEEVYRFKGNNIPEVWADYVLTDSNDLDERTNYYYDEVIEKISLNNQISFEITNLAKVIYLNAEGITGLETDIFSLEGIKYYDPIHFKNKNLLEFRLHDEGLIPESITSRQVNFSFRREDNHETKIFIIVTNNISFRRMGRYR